MLNVHGPFRRGAHLVGRRIWRLQLRVLGFEGQQALEERVKVSIWNRRLTVVVQLAVLAHLLRKLGPFALDIYCVTHESLV